MNAGPAIMPHKNAPVAPNVVRPSQGDQQVSATTFTMPSLAIDHAYAPYAWTP